MNGLSRRKFLQMAAAAGGGLAAPGLAMANPWAPIPGDPCCNSLKVLEIFCYGGMSQWENFWVSRDDGTAPDGLNWRGAVSDVESLDWSMCGSGTIGATDHTLFATASDDADGQHVDTEVNWGPATKPLWPWKDRCRAVVVRPGAGAGVHLLGIHSGLTGHRLGDPRAAGLGAAIQHRAQMESPQSLPYSYVLTPKEPGTFGYVTNFAMAPGLHPGSSTPLAVKLAENGFGDILDRSGISSTRDNLVEVFRQQYHNMLRFHGSGGRVRARDYGSYEAASRYTASASAELDDHIGGDQLALDYANNCVLSPHYTEGGDHNSTRRSIELAAYLMQNAGARHITVLDGGVHRVNGDSPYDTHNNSGSYSHAQVTSGNLWNVLDALSDIIQTPSKGGFEPNEIAIETRDPEVPVFDGASGGFTPGSKISLDNTLIVIHTEFNREPNFNDRSGDLDDPTGRIGGRDHSQGSGHVALLLGGPISGPSIAGNIRTSAPDSPETANPSTFFTPTDLHAALLMAVDIDPFAPENFRTSDEFGQLIKADGASEDAIRDSLRHELLGLGPHQAYVTL